MALSDTTVRQARITGNDYTLGDTDAPTFLFKLIHSFR